MNEIEQLAQELMEISKKRNGPLNEQQKVQIREFAESFLLLLDDTEE